MTRIISGKFRGKIIKAPALPVRPTTDFAKEALFNILNNHFYLDEISVLDLFAGTGNLSYEFASRGCTSVTAVDQNPKCCQFISKTSESLQFDIEVHRSDALEYVKRDYKVYDLIIADPPYDYTDYTALVDQVFFKKLIQEEGFLVIEHDRETDLSEVEHFYEMRKYGKVAFSFFQWTEETE